MAGLVRGAADRDLDNCVASHDQTIALQPKGRVNFDCFCQAKTQLTSSTQSLLSTVAVPRLAVGGWDQKSPGAALVIRSDRSSPKSSPSLTPNHHRCHVYRQHFPPRGGIRPLHLNAAALSYACPIPPLSSLNCGQLLNLRGANGSPTEQRTGSFRPPQSAGAPSNLPLARQTLVHGLPRTMNSLNILSGIGATPPPSPSRSRAGSESDISRTATSTLPRSRAYTDDVYSKDTSFQSEKGGGTAAEDQWSSNSTDEKTPLLDQQEVETFGDSKKWSGWLMPKRIATAVVGGLKAVFTVAAAPAIYLVSCFYDDAGYFSTLMPLYRIGRKFPRKKRRRISNGETRAEGDAMAETGEEYPRRRSGSGKGLPRKSPKRSPSVSSTTSSVAITSESESERPPTRDDDGPAKHTRSRSSLSGDEIAPARRSIRIKLHNEETLRNRKQRKSRTASITKQADNASSSPDAAAALKSPTNPGPSSKLKFPRAPGPPRPLVPRRQPSYATSAPSQFGPHQKTLILDLDETLIHSMAKGGRYTTGHMVEVKLNQPVGAAGQVVGPQVPILYYVHKRPYCDDFLRKVSKWYNLVIFTASVQEYADPVIDWLELERKYFAGRFYRQHCTFRNGAYIKDLAQVEPDLSKVMIVDNSPMSYIFHEGESTRLLVHRHLLIIAQTTLFRLKAGSVIQPITICCTWYRCSRACSTSPTCVLCLH